MQNNNNFMQDVQQFVQMCAGNPEIFAKRILQENPQFAQMLQGQNPQALLTRGLGQMGLDPRVLQGMIPTRRR